MEMMTPKEAVEILRAHGTRVSEEEAKIILEFMVNLANISLSQYLNHENSRPVYQGEHGRASR
jgi:hypothetical protein